MQSVLEKLVSNLVIAAFIPALVFVSLGYILFVPIMPHSFIERVNSISDQTGFLLLIASIVIGFTLFYANELILLIYRGEYFPKFMGYFERKKAKKLWEKLREADFEVYQFSKSRETDIGKLYELRDKQFSLAEDYQSKFPIYVGKNPEDSGWEQDKFQDGEIAATRLGNILGAAEDYATTRYKINTREIWPRLLQSIPPKKLAKLDEAQNHMLLLINFSFLFNVLAALSLIAVLYQWLLYLASSSKIILPDLFVSNLGSSTTYEYNSVISILGFVFFVVLAYVFYRGSLPIAQHYSKMYCCIFDLYRFVILDKLRLEPPDDSFKDLDSWEKASEHFCIGPFKYVTFTESNRNAWLSLPYINKNGESRQMDEELDDNEVLIDDIATSESNNQESTKRKKRTTTSSKLKRKVTQGRRVRPLYYSY